MTYRKRTTHDKAARKTWTIRPREDGIYIDKGGIEEGPLREGQVLTQLAKYLTTTVAPIVIGPNASLGRLSEAEHTYTDDGKHTAPFVVYDRTGREIDRGWNLGAMFQKHKRRFVKAAHTPRSLKDWDQWEPEPGVTVPSTPTKGHTRP